MIPKRCLGEVRPRHLTTHPLINCAAYNTIHSMPCTHKENSAYFIDLAQIACPITFKHTESVSIPYPPTNNIPRSRLFAREICLINTD